MRGVVGQKWRTSGYHYETVLAIDIGCGKDAGSYLVHHIFEGYRTVDGEADE